MGTYFHGNSEIQENNNNNGDGLQTLILMNHPAAYVGYSETQPPQTTNNFIFHNSNPAGNNHNHLHAPPSQQPQQHFVGIPLHNTSSTTQVQDASAFHGLLPRVNYNIYNPQMEITEAREFTRYQQGLSLTLSSSSQQNQGHGSYREVRPPPRVDEIRVSGGSPSSASGVSKGGVQSVLLSSKYLKVAQELLDEVVNVGKGDKGGVSGQTKTMGESSAVAAASGPGGDAGEVSEKRVAELTTAERQEIQMKKAKLVNMLDEVEQRYRQYHHQMQIVISWFEQATGIGSAKTYTALALETISRQFRCLKDAILGQIRATSKSLGEDENLGKIEGSRLKYVDNQIRQQRALQQLGMIQHNAWRPQRGLPERSVSVLRAWLFEHFLHPYPKDSDKIMLAKQTGLTRGQVSNWFINARVRLWKPMVEEMYMEEIKEHERNGSEDKTDQNQDSTSKSTAPQVKNKTTENQNNSSIPKQQNPINQNIPTTSTSPTIQTNSRFNLIRSSEIETTTHQSPKKPRNTEFLHSYMDSNTTNAENDHILKFGAPTNFIGGFGSYPIGELGRFQAEQFQASYSGNGVSLTLGLPHCENLAMLGGHQTFMPNQIDEANDHFNGMNNETSNHSNNVYESMSIQNRKRFAAQLLPDYVA